MEKIPELTYLKRITIVFLGLFTFFVLANLLDTICYGMIYSGKVFHSEMFRLFVKYEGKLYFPLNVCSYILQVVFLLVANRFIKNRQLDKGYHFLIILLAFVPVVNFFLRFIIWKKFNRQLFNYSGTESRKSDRKIITIWVLTLIGESYKWTMYLLFPVLSMQLSVSDVADVSILLSFTAKICYLMITILYFLYYLEFKRTLEKAQPSFIDNDSLLDD